MAKALHSYSVLTIIIVAMTIFKCFFHSWSPASIYTGDQEKCETSIIIDTSQVSVKKCEDSNNSQSPVERPV